MSGIRNWHTLVHVKNGCENGSIRQAEMNKLINLVQIAHIDMKKVPQMLVKCVTE